MEKKLFVALGLVIAAFVLFYLYNKYRVAPAVNFDAIGLVDMDQKPVSFASFKGKKTVVCFSASWCPNCLAELKEINAVKQEQLQDVTVLVISDEPLEKVKAFAEKTAYPFVFLKMDRPFNAIGIHAIPTSYILNAGQKVMKETVGYLNWADPSTCGHLKALMDQ